MAQHPEERLKELEAQIQEEVDIAFPGMKLDLNDKRNWKVADAIISSCGSLMSYSALRAECAKSSRIL